MGKAIQALFKEIENEEFPVFSCRMEQVQPKRALVFDCVTIKADIHALTRIVLGGETLPCSWRPGPQLM